MQKPFGAPVLRRALPAFSQIQCKLRLPEIFFETVVRRPKYNSKKKTSWKTIKKRAAIWVQKAENHAFKRRCG